VTTKEGVTHECLDSLDLLDLELLGTHFAHPDTGAKYVSTHAVPPILSFNSVVCWDIHLTYDS